MKRTPNIAPLGECTLKHKSFQQSKDLEWNSNPHGGNGGDAYRGKWYFSIEPEITREVIECAA